MATCTVPHYRDPDRPRRTDDGHTICAGCTHGLNAHLTALPRLYDDMVHLHTARRTGGEQSKISGTLAARLPIALNVADARKDLRDTVLAWAIYAHREARSVAPLTDTVTSAAHWLTVNADWIAGQEWAPQLVEAVRRVRSRAVRLLDPNPRQVFPIPGEDGLCVRQLDTTPCPGRMWVTIPTHDETESVITCDTCEHVYPAMSWLRLGRLVYARRAAA